MTTWSVAMNARLKALHADGEPFSVIAATMNRDFKIEISRNAAIGKALRLGLVRGKKPTRAITEHTTPRAARRTPFRKPTPLDIADDTTPDDVRDLPPDSSALAVTFAQLAESHCRFPIGDPASEDFRYCGAEKMKEGPYCGRHHRLTHTRATGQSSARWAPSWRVA